MGKTDYTPHGWAMEARLNAEDPLRNFLPSAGTLGSVSFPLKDSGARPKRLGGPAIECWMGLLWAPCYTRRPSSDGRVLPSFVHMQGFGRAPRPGFDDGSAMPVAVTAAEYAMM